jgi:hypothetical protein
MLIGRPHLTAVVMLQRAPDGEWRGIHLSPDSCQQRTRETARCSSMQTRGENRWVKRVAAIAALQLLLFGAQASWHAASRSADGHWRRNVT